MRIYARHILPNILSVLIVQVTLNFPQLILLETSLSFLGLGIQPPQTSLGLMLGEGRNYLATAWRTGIPAGIVIFPDDACRSAFAAIGCATGSTLKVAET